MQVTELNRKVGLLQANLFSQSVLIQTLNIE